MKKTGNSIIHLNVATKDRAGVAADQALEVSAPKPTLTSAQREKLAELEEVIKSGWKTFLEVGAALTQVRDQGLYLDKYGTFEEYCLAELGFSRPYAYNLMGSAAVSKQLSSIEDIGRKPLNEAQLRELISVPEEKRADAWKSAIKLAKDKPVTAKIVHQAAAKFKPRKTTKAGIEKPTRVKRVNLKPAFKLLTSAEKAARKINAKFVLKRLAALRKCLESLDV